VWSSTSPLPANAPLRQIELTQAPQRKPFAPPRDESAGRPTGTEERRPALRGGGRGRGGGLSAPMGSKRTPRRRPAERRRCKGRSRIGDVRRPRRSKSVKRRAESTRCGDKTAGVWTDVWNLPSLPTATLQAETTGLETTVGASSNRYQPTRGARASDVPTSFSPRLLVFGERSGEPAREIDDDLARPGPGKDAGSRGGRPPPRRTPFIRVGQRGVRPPQRELRCLTTPCVRSTWTHVGARFHARLFVRKSGVEHESTVQRSEAPPASSSGAIDLRRGQELVQLPGSSRTRGDPRA